MWNCYAGRMMGKGIALSQIKRIVLCKQTDYNIEVFAKEQAILVEAEQNQPLCVCV